MASLLARRTAQTICTRALPTHASRHVHLSAPVQKEGWFGNLLRGSKPTENPETPSPKVPEESGLHGRIKPLTVEPAVQDAAVKAASSTSTTENTSVPITTEAQDATSSTSDPIKKAKNKRKPLSPEKRTKLLEENILFLEPRLGRRPELKRPKIRKATWARTLGACQTEEELRKVVKLFPSWRDMGNNFEGSFSEIFVRRCILLKKPEIALEVFGNYAKYNVPLTLNGARELLNATYDKKQLSLVITITSLFEVYKLPPAAQDLPCCAMVVSACLKDGSADALVVGRALVPHLKKLLENLEPQQIPKTQEKGDDMPRVWASWALKKVDELLFKARGKREDWLRDWRLKSGHIADAQQF
ncbi:hypothetical protein P691DRAFT_706540 [Macrolepiota fuliginosa MF-IS2]|uniref:Uncharacterized protein n=1 Tax=Macrolepiota fuliginosa MF-IS2 TaxID=1400762 RepID=A0A9P5XA70_9AGAR|nr:hypothetical protein P691DRAFT_706540 [Macrolepiota fuliginosa MF-IS2]